MKSTNFEVVTILLCGVITLLSRILPFVFLINVICPKKLKSS